jgi:hypothetical protein
MENLFVCLIAQLNLIFGIEKPSKANSFSHPKPEADRLR